MEFTVSESQAMLFGALERAFREAAGVPAAIVIDNLAAAVLRHGRDEIVFNPAFLAFAEHWGFEPLAAARRPFTCQRRPGRHGAAHLLRIV